MFIFSVQSGGSRTSGSLVNNAQSSVESNTEQRQHRPVQHQDHRQQEQQEEDPQEEEQQKQQQEHRGVRNFNFLELLAENSRRFRNFGIRGREASFAIRPPAEGADTVR